MNRLGQIVFPFISRKSEDDFMQAQQQEISMLGESGLLVQTLPAWQVLLCIISSILSSFWEALLPPQAPRVLLGQHRTRWTLHLQLHQAPPAPCLSPCHNWGWGAPSQNWELGEPSWGAAEAHSSLFHCCCFRSSQRLQNSFLEIQAKEFSSGLGSVTCPWRADHQVPTRAHTNLSCLLRVKKNAQSGLIIAGVDSRETYLTQLLSPAWKSQWENYTGRRISQDFAKAGEIISVCWGQISPRGATRTIWSCRGTGHKPCRALPFIWVVQVVLLSARGFCGVHRTHLGAQSWEWLILRGKITP